MQDTKCGNLEKSKGTVPFDFHLNDLVNAVLRCITLYYNVLQYGFSFPVSLRNGVLLWYNNEN